MKMVTDSEKLNQTLLAKKHQRNNQLQEACKELTERLCEMAHKNIIIKEMGETDTITFQEIYKEQLLT